MRKKEKWGKNQLLAWYTANKTPEHYLVKQMSINNMMAHPQVEKVPKFIPYTTGCRAIIPNQICHVRLEKVDQVMSGRIDTNESGIMWQHFVGL